MDIEAQSRRIAATATLCSGDWYRRKGLVGSSASMLNLCSCR